jgi:replicative DNA helicase
VGGRPGSFKTGLLWNLAVNAALSQQRVLFVTLEMTPGEMAFLALAMFSGIERHRLEEVLSEASSFTPEEQAAWDGAVLRLQGLQFTMRLHGAEHGRSVEEILASASRARFDAVFVDHLGMVGRDSAGRELDVLSQAIHRLRGLSRGEVVQGYRPWVVATSQLNREIDKGDEDRVPRMADFRGSSRIEHDADVAIGLQKRKGSKEDGPISCLDGFVLKNRQGPAPSMLLWEANGATGLIVERHKDEAPPRHWQESEEDAA